MMSRTVPLSEERAERDTRRQLPDRRRNQYVGVNLRQIGVGGRRLRARRSTDKGNHYVDWYEARLLLSGLGIIACCCIDAFFTLQLLQMGATELNAVMAYMIETDIQRFVNYKIAMTGLSVVLLTIHSKYRLFSRLRVEHLIHAALLAYLALIGWELTLLANPPPV